MFISNEMTGRERVIAALKGKDVDRIPVINPTSVATLDSMNKSQAFFPKAHYDANKMAALAATGYELLGFDTVSPYFSILLEAAALGCDIDWGQKDTMPEIKKESFKMLSASYCLKTILNKRNVKALLEAIVLLKKRYNDKVAIVGKVIGPLTLAYHLYGVQRFLLKLMVEPENAKKIMEDLSEISIKFAYAQIEMGADVITWADHATGNLISAECYKNYLLPIQHKAVQELNKTVPVILHTCGDVNDRLIYIVRAGFTAFHFDSRNNLLDLLQVAKNHISLIGGINNPQLLLNGTTDQVRRNIFRLLHMGVVLVSPECAVPPRTPNKNLKEVVNSVRYFNRQIKSTTPRSYNR